MKNKRINRLLATTMAIGMLVTSLGSSVHAMEDSKLQAMGSSSLQVMEIGELRQYYTENNIKFEETKNSHGDIELTFTDAEIYKAAKDAGYDVDMSVLDAKANGVNKIVWRTDGGFDLYVSKNTLLLVAGAGIGALSFLLGPFAPGVVAIISSAIGMYLGGNITDGRVFRFTKVMTGKYTYTYAYLKSWAQ